MMFHVDVDKTGQSGPTKESYRILITTLRVEDTHMTQGRGEKSI